jgi:hypothetical protein
MSIRRKRVLDGEIDRRRRMEVNATQPTHLEVDFCSHSRFKSIVYRLSRSRPKTTNKDLIRLTLATNIV